MLLKDTDAVCEALKSQMHDRHREMLDKMTSQLQLRWDSRPDKENKRSEAVMNAVSAVRPQAQADGAEDAATGLADVHPEIEESTGDAKDYIKGTASRGTSDDDCNMPNGNSASTSSKVIQAKTVGANLLNLISPTDSTRQNRQTNSLIIGSKMEMTGRIKCVNTLVESPYFEGFVTLMILFSVVAIAVEVQVVGLHQGFELQFGQIDHSPLHDMPWIVEFLGGLDVFFGVVFTVEITLKIVGFRHYFFMSMSNLLDFFCILFWYLENTAGVGLNLNPMILRVIRLFKVMRLFKLARTVDHLESLFLLIESIKASKSVCFWATVLLSVIQTGVGIFLNQALGSIMSDETLDMTARHTMFKYFGTFTRCMVTMLEVTFGNFVPVCRMLQDINEWYALVIIVYKLLVGFAAIRIISGIFMAETLRVANNNDQIMVMQKKRRQRETREKMTRLFKAADKSGDGEISLEEFLSVFENEIVKTWLSAQDLEIGDPTKFFWEIAGDDDTITAQEMISGVGRLKGFARAIDMVHLVKDHDVLHKEHKEHRAMTTELVKDHHQQKNMVGHVEEMISELQGRLEREHEASRRAAGLADSL